MSCADELDYSPLIDGARHASEKSIVENELKRIDEYLEKSLHEARKNKPGFLQRIYNTARAVFYLSPLGKWVDVDEYYATWYLLYFVEEKA